jgi:uncharacterized protein (TIGR00255 family)
MIKSMTGFGKGEVKNKLGVFTAEIRAVNHRYFDFSAKIPNSLTLLEDRIKELLHKDIKRGKVNLFLSCRSIENEYETVSFNKQAVAKYQKILVGIKKQLGIKEEIRLSHVLSFADVITREQKPVDMDMIWLSVKEAVVKAASDCNKMREREGRALSKDFVSRISALLVYVEAISDMAPLVVTEYKQRLDSRIKDIVKNKDIDNARLETELALFAKQCDISEEITRFKSHLEGFTKAMETKEEAGRKLDFILQELNREVNTLGAKANDIKIARLVINIKSELEKMREQAQNIE